MALPIEQITQRTGKSMVAFQSDSNDDAAAETVWQITTDMTALTMTANVTPQEDYRDRMTVDKRLKTSADAARLGGGVNELQAIRITGTPTGGTFKLTFGADETTALAHSASAATVQTALEGLASIGASNVAVTGGALPGNLQSVEFKGALAKTNVGLIQVTNNSLTGGTSPKVETYTMRHGHPDF